MTAMTDQEARQVQRVLRESDLPMHPGDEEGTAPEVTPDRRRNFRSPNFSRMRTTWSGEDRIVVEELKVQADKLVRALFGDAFEVIDRLYLHVRQPVLNADHTMKLGADGRPMWRCHPSGTPIEDWTALGDRDRKNFLDEITVHLFGWEQNAADLWGEALIAKVRWEQAFGEGYSGSGGKTVEDRTQQGTLASVEDRYFGVFQSLVSRKAEALVRSMTRLDQRLKDSIQL